jgi:hypothetical protein
LLVCDNSPHVLRATNSTILPTHLRILTFHFFLCIIHGWVGLVNMVVARPVRLLIAVSAGLVLFLFYKLLNPAPPLHVPVDGWNGEKIEAMERDPLLDRKVYREHFRRIN